MDIEYGLILGTPFIGNFWPSGIDSQHHKFGQKFKIDRERNKSVFFPFIPKGEPNQLMNKLAEM